MDTIRQNIFAFWARYRQTNDSIWVRDIWRLLEDAYPTVSFQRIYPIKGDCGLRLPSLKEQGKFVRFSFDNNEVTAENIDKLLRMFERRGVSKAFDNDEMMARKEAEKKDLEEAVLPYNEEDDEQDPIRFFTDIEYYSMEAGHLCGDMGYYFQDMEESGVDTFEEAVENIKFAINDGYFDLYKEGGDIPVISVVSGTPYDYSQPLYSIALCDEETGKKYGINANEYVADSQPQSLTQDELMEMVKRAVVKILREGYDPDETFKGRPDPYGFARDAAEEKAYEKSMFPPSISFDSFEEFKDWANYTKCIHEAHIYFNLKEQEFKFQKTEEDDVDIIVYPSYLSSESDDRGSWGYIPDGPFECYCPSHPDLEELAYDYLIDRDKTCQQLEDEMYR